MNEMTEIETAIEATQSAVVPATWRDKLVADLRPIADRLESYAVQAREISVSNKTEADCAAMLVSEIDNDIKAVKNHEILYKIKRGLDALHHRFTGLEGLFVKPLQLCRGQARQKVIDWELKEAKRIAEIQRKLQEESNEKTARDKAALLKKAESMKTPEKKEEYAERANSLITPTITIDVPKSSMRTSRVWAVTEINEDLFYAALATRLDLRGYVTIDKTRLQRSKAANPSMEVPGVRFEQVVR